MAKKKKLNKRAVTILIVFGVVVVALATASLVKYSLPKDPVKAAARGDEEFAKGNFGEALRNYSTAARFSRSNAEYVFKMAKTRLEILKSSPQLTSTEKAELFQAAKGDLTNAVRYADNAGNTYAEPQRLLADIAWSMAVIGRNWAEYIRESTKLLKITPTDHLTYLKRGVAQAEEMARVSANDRDPQKLELILADFDKAIELKSDEVRYWLEKVAFLQRLKMEDEIVATFESGIAKNPDATPMRAAYATYLNSKGKHDDARKQIDEAIRRNPDATAGYIARAQHYQGLNDLPAAMAALDEALTKDDSDAMVYREKAHILVRQGLRPQACEELRKGAATVAAKLEKPDLTPTARVRLEESKWNLHYVLANVLLDSLEVRTPDVDEPKVLADSREQLEELRRLAPNSIQCAKIAGLLAYHEGKVAESVKLLEKALWTSEGAMELQTANTLIGAYMRLGQLTKAKGVLEDMHKLPSQDKNPSTLVALAELLMLTRDYPMALNRVTEALRGDSSFQAALTLKSVLAVLMGERNTLGGNAMPDTIEMSMLLERVMQLWTENQNEHAVGLLEDLHRRAPGHQGVISRLLDVYVAYDLQGRMDELKEEVKNDPALSKWLAEEREVRLEKDPQKRFKLMTDRAMAEANEPLQQALNLANAAAMMRRDKEYTDALRQAVEIDANNPDVIERMFGLGLRTRDWKLAEEWASKAAVTNADGLEGRLFSARLAMIQGEYPKAIEVLNEILQRRPEDKTARTMLADCYRRSNELDKAKKEYLEVLGIDPVHPSAVIGMAMLAEMQNDRAEHRRWVELAWKLPEGQQNSYIKAEDIKIRSIGANVEDLPNLIEQRKILARENPDDLENVHLLGLMCEQVRLVKDAESSFRYIYDRSGSKINGVRPLAEFYIRAGRFSDLITLLTDLDNKESDKVAVQIIMGDYLRAYSPDVAMRAYAKAKEIDPNDRRGSEALARFYERQRQWLQAADEYDKYLTLAQTDRTAQREQIRCFIEGRSFPKAADAIKAMLAKDPSDADTLWLKGLLYTRQKDYPEALRAYELALAVNPGHVNTLLSRAKLYLVQGETEKASNDLGTVRKLTNVEPATTMEYADLCQQLGNFNEAEIAYREVLTHAKDYSPAHRSLLMLFLDRANWSSLEAQLTESRHVFPTEPTFALIEFQMWKTRKDEDKDHAKAMKAIELAVSLAPESPEVAATYLLWLADTKQFAAALTAAESRLGKPGMAVLATSVKARALAGQDKIAEADKLFLALLKTELTPPQLGQLGSLISDAYTPAKASVKLEGWFNELHPKDPQYGVLLGMLFNEAGDSAKGVTLLKAAREQMTGKEQRASVTLTIANAYYKAKQYSQAEAAWLEVLQTQPEEMQSLNNLAYLYANHLQQPEKALPFARRAIEEQPGNANVVDTYGWVLAKLNRIPEATEILKRAATLGGRQPVFYYHLGFVYEQSKLYSEAQSQYKLGLQAAEANADVEMQKTLQEASDSCRTKMAAESEK